MLLVEQDNSKTVCLLAMEVTYRNDMQFLLYDHRIFPVSILSLKSLLCMNNHS